MPVRVGAAAAEQRRALPASAVLLYPDAGWGRQASRVARPVRKCYGQLCIVLLHHFYIANKFIESLLGIYAGCRCYIRSPCCQVQQVIKVPLLPLVVISAVAEKIFGM